MVRLVIEYDMDDEEKPLQEELQDWLKGNVGINDILGVIGEADTVQLMERRPEGGWDVVEPDYFAELEASMRSKA